MQTVFNSIELPVQERAEAWRHVTSSALIPTRIHLPEPPVFAAQLEVKSLGAAHITAMSYTKLFSYRTPKLIRQSDPEHYQMAVVRTGLQGIEQNRTRNLVRSGELVVYDSSQPFEASCLSNTVKGRSVVLQFPKALLPLPAARITRLLAVPLPASRGIGRLLTQFLITLAEDRIDCTEADALRLERTAIDLTVAVLAHHLEADAPSPVSQAHLLYLRILSFIEQNLHRADLDTAAIAAAHHISVRYLHRIFQRHHHAGVSAHVRARRLDHCRRDLADPAQCRVTIVSIAGRWGFTRAAEFSRLFRRETGCSPSDYRTAALTGNT
ncbi:helix-turn-helix domain-containing protein [Spongiactinospora sp. TRM90649]|uniref:helix-turn-helix domain-containing protein n=1 Tax=Spongiactinospora sp. TRM90649 TaxID=3031114 RepID=UPI0023F77B31|nr:helix-turn-helix domain-containing protein [Spongiactinospora sp. TRM90649]MDF5755170.1 helix-turn-helix domain-containing protein [Spongiactinospora sp. TRM90649]